MKKYLLFLALFCAVGAATWGYMAADDAGLFTAKGTDAIHGQFALTSHQGKKVTSADFNGVYRLVFFGFTHCPDICPTALGGISAALDKLSPADIQKIQPLFITVDPARDTQARLTEYLKNFNPRIIGLTGSDAEIADAQKAFRVFAQRAEPAPESHGQSHGEGHEAHEANYMMDHSSIIYLMAPDGSYLANFPFDIDSAQLRAEITNLMK